MTTTLQEAMLKAGLITKDKLKKSESEQKRSRPLLGKGRERTPQRAVGFVERKHDHHLRTECEVCNKTHPDVEYYEHRNRRIEKKWLCLKCADQYCISDECRQTVQSQNARAGIFRREYGKTKVFK